MIRLENLAVYKRGQRETVTGGRRASKLRIKWRSVGRRQAGRARARGPRSGLGGGRECFENMLARRYNLDLDLSLGAD